MVNGTNALWLLLAVSVGINVWGVLRWVRCQTKASGDAAALRGSDPSSVTAVLQAAAEASANRDAALRMVVHELKTPVQAIVGGVGILKRRVTGPPELVTVLDATLESTDVLVSRIADLSSLRTLGRLAFTVRSQAFSLSSLLTSIRDAHLPSAKINGHKIVLDDSVDVADVICDPKLLRQVLDNLLDNAIKYSPKFRTIRIASKVAMLNYNFGRLYIDISDNGVGVAESDFDQIFKPFIRLPGASGTEGLGLGLAVVKQILAALDGRISLRSEVGNGSTFSIEIPIKW